MDDDFEEDEDQCAFCTEQATVKSEDGDRVCEECLLKYMEDRKAIEEDDT